MGSGALQHTTQPLLLKARGQVAHRHFMTFYSPLGAACGLEGRGMTFRNHPLSPQEGSASVWFPHSFLVLHGTVL